MFDVCGDDDSPGERISQAQVDEGKISIFQHAAPSVHLDQRVAKELVVCKRASGNVGMNQSALEEGFGIATFSQEGCESAQSGMDVLTI